MKGRSWWSFLLVGGAVVALLISSGLLEIQFNWRSNMAEAIDLFNRDTEKPSSQTGAPFWEEGNNTTPPVASNLPVQSFAELAERASVSVVSIQTSKTVTQGGNNRVPNPFEDFFGSPFEEFFRRRDYKVPSLGSGFVISKDGYIVTNNHVVEDVDSIRVKFDDGLELDAEIVGRDPKTDLALIRVESEKPLAALPLGDSDAIRPGDWVVAIGNPFGLEHTVTAGIVSAKHRRIGQGNYDDFIQTDAAINPGNSGGPLINLSGEVVGINTAINPRANTIGFAVPVNMAKDILPQLQIAGRVVRGWLGVVIQQISEDLAEQFELDSTEGALVTRIDPSGPAAEAGIERGDVIVEFDGQRVAEMEALPRLVAATEVGKSVNLVVIRDGKRKKIKVEIGELDDATLVAENNNESDGVVSFGLRVQDLTPELAEQLGVEEGAGVVITQVEPSSAADEAKLRRGDVILEVERQAITNTRDLRKQLGETKEKALLLIRRGDATLYVALKRDNK